MRKSEDQGAVKTSGGVGRSDEESEGVTRRIADECAEVWSEDD